MPRDHWDQMTAMLRTTLAFALLGWHTIDGFRVAVDLNTYTSTELAFAEHSWAHEVDGSWSLVNNSAWNGTATLPTEQQWRDALGAIGRDRYSEEMWPCSAADNAAWNCSSVAKQMDHSAGQCRIVQRLTNESALTGAFAYHETGTTPHTMLSMREITAVSNACGGCGVIGHTRLYEGPWQQMVDAVLAHPMLLGVAMEIDITKYSRGHPVFGSAGPFAQALLAAGKHPFFLLPFKANGANTTGMRAAQQMKAFLRNASSEVVNASLLSDSRVTVVVARYSHGGQLPVFGDGDDTVAAAVAAALEMKRSAAASAAAAAALVTSYF